MKKTSTILTIIFLLLVVVGGLYWYFLMGPNQAAPSTDNTTPDGFNPFGTNPSNGRQDNNGGTDNNGGADTNTDNGPTTEIPGTLPTLRLLSSTPVGGYGVMSSTTTTIVRWADRGRGNIYQADYLSKDIVTLSNTVVPRIYESQWNKNLNSFIGTLFQEGDSAPTAVYAELMVQPASASSDNNASLAPYSLHGKNLPANMIAYAVSPDKSKLFMLVNEGGNGVGYVSSISGQSTVKIFTTPLTQLNADWPSDNIIAITTKGSASYSGYLYFVNPKTGVWTKQAGPLLGLVAKVSHDGKHAIISSVSGGSLTTKLYTFSPFSSTDAVINTIADKCAWGNFYKDVVYCAVPSSLPSGTYPDDWYTGRLSTSDKLWQVNAGSGEVHLISSVVDKADRTIDGYNLSLDSKDNYLFFMNKGDLSLWSLDLVQSH